MEITGGCLCGDMRYCAAGEAPQSSDRTLPSRYPDSVVPCRTKLPRERFSPVTQSGHEPAERDRALVTHRPAQGTNVIRHDHSITFGLAEVVERRGLFTEILRSITGLAPALPP